MHFMTTRAALLVASAIAAAGSLAAGFFLTLAPAAHADSPAVSVGTPTNRFTPNITTIHVGDTVTFNWSAGFHIVDLEDVSPDMPIDSSHTTGTTMPFNTPGTFFYYCSIHADQSEATEAHVEANDAMVGKIVVLANNQTATATATTPAATPTQQPATPTATTTSTPSAGITQTPNQACILKVMDVTVPAGSNQVLVPETQQVDAGYLAIHESTSSGGPGNVIGVSGYLPGGSDNVNIVVTVNRPLKDGEVVWPMLHTENNGNHTYDGASIDLPTVSTHCGDASGGNIAMAPVKISFQQAGGTPSNPASNGGTNAPAAPNTGSGNRQPANNDAMIIILGSMAAILVAGGAGLAIVRRRR